MKKQSVYVILAIFLMTQLGFAATAADYALISGTISIPEVSIKEITIYKAEDGKPVVAATTKTSASGEFGFMLPITTPGFYYIDYGQYKKRGQLLRFYLEPKLDISLAITEKKYVLSGKNIGQNALVQKANEIYNDFAAFNALGKNITYKDFYPFIDGGLAKAETFKKTINTKDQTFNKLLKLAVTTDVQDQSYVFFMMPRSVHPEKDNRPAVMQQWKTDIKFTDPDLLKLANGVGFMSDYFMYMRMFGDKETDRLEYLPEAITGISDPALKDAYLRDGIERSGFRTEEYEKVAPKIRPYLISEASKAFLVEYEKKLHKNVGQKGFEFTYKDVNDKAVSFSDFKGKYIYVDLWATWCGPCKHEIPHMKKLEEDYHTKNIVFISLSLDKMKDLQKWKDFVKTEDLKGIQLMADKDFESDIAKNYDVRSIPRFLLFDKEGKIINTDAMRPSEPELREELDKLLKV
ncbi:TlpA family protein disulfide reductase [Flavobacterium chilense]|uniref:Thiol-disulfide isomerase or thioredoxin n=1 Tax=Flavobacterium chilense TaxID=946677 RepID=A0A1M6X8R7_9FLAO|nr:TlpA family protein disulfide reductase [Flavobacterium chilense]SHL02323.1 Thiol-disulfide isomerase or thioredoxin [Flavobacterium chilense]